MKSVVIGAGQAGLSAAFHLRRKGLRPFEDFVVLDANASAGGAWQHRWATLTMADVHGVAALPGLAVPDQIDAAQANTFVPQYFSQYEQRFDLPIIRPARVDRVEDVDGRDLKVSSDAGTWLTSTVVNATGTWEHPFFPHYPGAQTFRGRQLHAASYPGPDRFAGQHVVVVGGGASAVQLLAEISTVASTTWVTRRPPVWRTTPFTAAEGRAAVARVEDRVRRGLAPHSVVDVTGLALRDQERAAEARGVYDRRPMFQRVEPDGVKWADGSFQRADAIVWATGFRAALSHLAPLRLRERSGGIRLDGTTVVRDPRIQLVGYGPSASTIGANRAGRQAAVRVLAEAA